MQGFRTVGSAALLLQDGCFVVVAKGVFKLEPQFDHLQSCAAYVVGVSVGAKGMVRSSAYVTVLGIC